MTGGKAQQRASREVQRFKVAGIVLAAIVVWSSLVPLFGVLLEARIYNLSPKARQVVGKANSNLSRKFSYNSDKKTWQFNREGMALKADMIAEQQDTDASGVAKALSQMQQQVGGGGEDDKSLYSVNLPEDGSKAVTYYDNNTQQSFKMTPQFDLRDGKLKDGQLIYPLYGGGQLVYTAKTNGLKEDIVLEKSLGDSLDFSYSLDLPKTLEARLQEDGSVGVFSADIALYGNVMTGSDMDQAKLDSARETAPKDHLLFAIPAPVIKDAEGVEKSGKFSLKGDTLKVHAKGLDELAYPLSIDPSVVVTSSNDFSTGNNEGGIAYSPSNSMSVAPVTGGLFDGTWTSQTNISTDTGNSHAIPRVAVYNGYLYMINGGHVEMATINSSGVIGTWDTSPTNTNTINAHGNGTGIVAYNGYLYVVGGQGANTGVEYASLNPSTGAMGTWTSTTSLPSATFAAVTAVMNGYLYVAGGYGGSTLSTVRYAKLNANGTVGSWSTTTALPQVRTTGSGFAYNGYLYVGGGYVDENNTLYSSVIYAKQNSDGTLGSWITTSSMSQAGPGLAMTVVGGYAYAFGGAATTTYANGSTRAEYAQINANGSLGTWRTNSNMTLTQARTNLGSFSYANGTDSYVYVLGGRDQATGGYRNTVHSAKIASAGAATSWTSGTSVGTARAGMCTVIYNNYIYAIGGSTSNSLTNRVTTIEYATINASTGVIGTWATTTALPVARTEAGCAAYGGRLYVAGGADVDNTRSATTRYITINTNGTLAASWSNGTDMAGGAMLVRNMYTHTLSNGNTYLYALGVYNSSGLNNITYTQINTNGTLATWTATANLPSDANGPGFAKVGNYLYAIGGTNSTSTGTFDRVQYTTINSDGTLAAWSTTTSLPSARGFPSVATVNGCIYSITGYDNSIAVTSSAYYACPAANGTISTWNTALSLGTAKYNTAVASYGGYIYSVGGGTNTSGAVTASTEYAKVNNGGSGSIIGAAWVADSDVAVVDNRFRHATVVYNGYVYVIAGSVNGGGDITTQTVEYAPINANGTLGSWVADTHEIPAARVYPAAAAYNGYMYMSGGQATGGGAFLKSILYAPISSAGALSGNWASAGGDTTNGGSGASLVAYNGYLYSLGGWDGTTDYNTVQYAAINSNGTIGAWNSTSSFTTGRSNLSPFVYGGYMYIAGGEGASLMNDIQVAQINSNGTLGSWTYTNPFTGARKDTVATAYNGFVYVTGGNDSTSSLADVQFAPILSGGQIGPWQRAFAPVNGDPVGARSPSGQAVWNGRLYRAGGAMLNGSNSITMSGSKYLELDSIARIARYSKLVSLPAQAGTVTVNYGGTFTPDTDVQFATAGSNNIFGSLARGSATVGSDPGGSCTIPTLNTVWLTAVIDDSRWATFGGSTASNITDISVFYSDLARATPNQRLFGGKWFKNEVLQGLDICGNS